MKTTYRIITILSLCFGVDIISSAKVIALGASTDIPMEVENKIQKVFGRESHPKLKVFNQQLIEISAGARTYFASRDGRYIFAGPILDINSQKNIVDEKERQYRHKRIANLGDDMVLKFKATTSPQYTVTLFTDIDCGYCRKFHSNMAQLNALGISINYVMLPRAGKHSDSYNKTVSVLCSSKPQENMTLAMKDRFQQSGGCNNSVDEQLALAEELGINLTPTMILPNGEIKVGLTMPDELLSILSQQKL